MGDYFGYIMLWILKNDAGIYSSNIQQIDTIFLSTMHKNAAQTKPLESLWNLINTKANFVSDKLFIHLRCRHIIYKCLSLDKRSSKPNLNTIKNWKAGGARANSAQTQWKLRIELRYVKNPTLEIIGQASSFFPQGRPSAVIILAWLGIVLGEAPMGISSASAM